MAKKNWIFVKRGLSEDAKHRERMGIFIWLFLHIIDRADWEEGIAYDWKDKDEASDMGMPLVTLRYQRRKLEELGYITCKKKQSRQEITIHNWINPRNYSGKSVNPKSGKSLPLSESDNQSDNQSDNRPYVAVNTPTLDSRVINQKPDGLAQVVSIYESNFGLATNIITDALQTSIESYSAEWVEAALVETRKAGAKSLRYAESILERWKRDGFKSSNGKFHATAPAAPPVKMFNPAEHPEVTISADERARALALMEKRNHK